MTNDQSSKTLQIQSIDNPPTGNWVFWSCLFLALFGWGAAGAILTLQADALGLASLSLPLLIAGGLLILIPGILLILMGLIARQSVRSRTANALIMQAAGELLAPAHAATNEIKTLADATRESTRAIDTTTSDTLASLKTMHEALSAERLRAESVSYAMADNARELTERLAEERKGLETLTKAMEAQANMMREVIPQQSAAMVAAAKAASQEVQAADEALEIRLNHLKQAGSTLAVRLTDLDAIARDAAERTDGLLQSIAAIEDKLSRSDNTVARAEQSSAIAAEAASSVGQALQDAVSAALDGAREANAEIDRMSRKLHEDTARAVTELRLAGIDAANGQPVGPLAKRARPNEINPPSTHQLDSLPDHNDGPIIDTIDRPPAPMDVQLGLVQTRTPAPPLPPRTAPTATDTDLFDGNDNGPTKPETITQPTIQIDPSHQAKPNLTGWSDIISELDSEANQSNNTSIEQMDRQQIAIGLMDRLQGSGIALPTIFRPRDKKKIAAASRKSAKARRSATRSISGTDVDRVYNRIRKDQELNAMAQAFIDHEQDEALKALSETSGSGRPASPRLAAFLLADAALTAD